MNLLAAGARVLAQAEEATDLLTARANRVCGNLPTLGEETAGDVNTLCREVFRLTENRWLALSLGTVIPPAVRIAIIIGLAWLAHRLLRRTIQRFVRQLNERGVEKLEEMARSGPLTDTAPINLQRATMRTETIAGVLHSVATVAIWTVAVLMAFGVIGFDVGPLIAGAGIAGVALGFGAQSLVKDFLSGLFMIMEDQFGVGDIVDVGEATGTVEAITLRSSRIRDVSGTLWHVPNGEIRRVGNMSQLWSRALLDVGVAYATDLAEAGTVMQRAADQMAAEPEWSAYFFEPAELWGVQALAADGVTLRMVAKVTPAKQWAIERELRARIKQAFDEVGIEIPFPQRTIWVRRDDDGAEPAEEDLGVRRG